MEKVPKSDQIVFLDFFFDRMFFHSPITFTEIGNGKFEDKISFNLDFQIKFKFRGEKVFPSLNILGRLYSQLWSLYLSNKFMTLFDLDLFLLRSKKCLLWIKNYKGSFLWTNSTYLNIKSYIVKSFTGMEEPILGLCNL